MASPFSSLVDIGVGILGGLRDDDRNARSAADARQSDERGAERQMDFQKAEASTARGWMENLANTSHQRQASDLQAAGLNRILSGTGGSGAASLSSPSPSGSKAGAALQTASQTGMGAVNTAMHARRLREELKNMEVTNENIRVDTDKKLSEKALNSMLYNRTRWETDRAREEAGTAEHERSIAGDNAKGRRLEGQIDQTRFGEILRYINRATGSVNSAGSVRNMFRQR